LLKTPETSIIQSIILAVILTGKNSILVLENPRIVL